MADTGCTNAGDILDHSSHFSQYVYPYLETTSSDHQSHIVGATNGGPGITNLAYDDCEILDHYWNGCNDMKSQHQIDFQKVEKYNDNTADGSKPVYRSLFPFIVVFGLGSLFSQSISVYLSSQITVLEKAFGMSSAKSGILLGANDIGFVATVLLVSHFCKHHNIPRILGLCILTFGISGMLASLPHFILHEKESSKLLIDNSSTVHGNIPELCIPVTTNTITDTTMCSHTSISLNNDTAASGSNEWVVALIAILMVIQGVAKAPRSPLSSLYVDNNSKKEKTGFYIGILMSFSIFGPFIGIVAGGLFNKIPVDLGESSISPKDPRWIGAWWLGFVVFGACSILMSLPIFCFPYSLRKTGSPHVGPDNSISTNLTAEDQKHSFTETVKDMPKSVVRVIGQQVYTCNILSILFVMFGFMALASFGPKYTENQFHIPTWKANILLGLEKMFTTVAGTFIGGLLTRRFKLSMYGCVKMILVSRSIAFMCQCFNFVFGCDNPDILGLKTNESETMQILHNLSHSYSGNMSCDCSSAPYMPVCADGLTYFSPCHAGCQTEVHTGYANCSAIPSGHVSPGICDTGCNYLIPFIILNAFGSLFGTLTIAPSYVTMLRSVPEKDRAMAIGIQSFLMSLLVFLPAPIVYGAFFDSVCLVWKSRSTCSWKGSCELYDITAMRYKLISIGVSLYAVGVVCACFTVYFARRKIAPDEQNQTITITTKSPTPLVRTT